MEVFMKVCSVEGCGKKYHAKGLCLAHYHNKRYHDNPEAARARVEKYLQTHPENRITSSAKYNAKKRNIEFDITPDDIVIPTHCPILGIKLNRKSNVGKGKRGPKSGAQAGNSPSIDRIDSSKGYIKGNVHVISWRANHIKNDATKEELEKLLKWMNENEN
jgi:hypothetical protein